jgi:hypothetical protein
MVKIIVIFLAIFFGALLFFTYALKKLKNFFGKFQPQQSQSSTRRAEENVIYKHDDVVVLKGEAANKDNKEKPI